MEVEHAFGGVWDARVRDEVLLVHARLQEQALQLTLVSKVIEGETSGASDAPDRENRLATSIEYRQVFQRVASLAASIVSAVLRTKAFALFVRSGFSFRASMARESLVPGIFVT